VARASSLCYSSPTVALLGWLVFLASANLSVQPAKSQEPSHFGGLGFDPYGGPPQQLHGNRLQILPDGLIYAPYLAGPKESRMATEFFYGSDDEWTWAQTLGGQLGILRYGSVGAFNPTGFQLDIEGSAQLRSDGADPFDIAATDYRFGIPLTFGWGMAETKFAIYLLRSRSNQSLSEQFDNLSDLLESEDVANDLFERSAFVLGQAFQLDERWRLYGEAGYAFQSESSGNWEFQFGIESAPTLPTRFWGAPFVAANVYLLETNNFGGNLNLQAGWAWRGGNGQLLRIGGFYTDGFTSNFALNDGNEQKVGLGGWYDF
jgi:hypothetical protein